MVLSDLGGRLPWWTTLCGIEVTKIELLPISKVKFEFKIENEDGDTIQEWNDGGETLTSKTPIYKFGTWKLSMMNPKTPSAEPILPPTGLWMVVRYKAVER